MADSQGADAQTEDKAKARSGSNVRMIVLLVVLAIMLAAFGWDYLVARPGHAAAIEKAKKLLPDEDGPVDAEEAMPKAVTMEDVHRELGIEPTSSRRVGGYTIEHYAWQRGIPFMTYNLWMIYAGADEKILFDRTTVAEEVARYDAVSEPTAVPADDPGFSPDDPKELTDDDEGDVASDESSSDEPTTDDTDAPADDS